MARVNNLTNFLTDVSSAIKQKTGDNTPIPASNFDTEILSIETGGNYQSKTLNITQNGNYNLLPDIGYDAMDQVSITVNVPTGTDTSDATATAEDIKAGKTAYVDGEKITGIYVDENLTDVLDAQDQKIAELEQSLENKTAGEKAVTSKFTSLYNGDLSNNKVKTFQLDSGSIYLFSQVSYGYSNVVSNQWSVRLIFTGKDSIAYMIPYSSDSAAQIRNTFTSNGLELTITARPGAWEISSLTKIPNYKSDDILFEGLNKSEQKVFTLKRIKNYLLITRYNKYDSIFLITVGGSASNTSYCRKLTSYTSYDLTEDVTTAWNDGLNFKITANSNIEYTLIEL